jgi:hypothetical protein
MRARLTIMVIVLAAATGAVGIVVLLVAALGRSGAALAVSGGSGARRHRGLR